MRLLEELDLRITSDSVKGSRGFSMFLLSAHMKSMDDSETTRVRYLYKRSQENLNKDHLWISENFNRNYYNVTSLQCKSGRVYLSTSTKNFLVGHTNEKADLFIGIQVLDASSVDIIISACCTSTLPSLSGLSPCQTLDVLALHLFTFLLPGRKQLDFQSKYARVMIDKLNLLVIVKGDLVEDDAPKIGSDLPLYIDPFLMLYPSDNNIGSLYTIALKASKKDTDFALILQDCYATHCNRESFLSSTILGFFVKGVDSRDRTIEQHKEIASNILLKRMESQDETFEPKSSKDILFEVFNQLLSKYSPILKNKICVVRDEQREERNNLSPSKVGGRPLYKRRRELYNLVTKGEDLSYEIGGQCIE